MNIRKLIKNGANLGVFTRNHGRYMEEAFEISRHDPSRLVTFRARTEWASALSALDGGRPVIAYIAVVDQGPSIRYIARLGRVILKPRIGQPETDHLLDLCAPSASKEKEGLWNDGSKSVQTLYAISHVGEAAEPFPMTALHKVSDDQPISPDYGYSYTVVHARLQDTHVV